MLAQAQMSVLHLLGAAPDGRWLGNDFVWSLLASTFPAWTLFTLVRGWVRGSVAPAYARPGAAE